MNKETYCFKQYSIIKDDPKCVLLIEQLGMEGYGIYRLLIDILKEQPNYSYPINLTPSLARKYNATPEKVTAVILGYGLFVINKGCLSLPKVEQEG